MYNRELLIPEATSSESILSFQFQQKAMRDGLGDGLMYLGEENPAVVVVNADLPGSLKVDKFAASYPQRFFQVGVAEQVMASIGTGLALQGKIPFITSFAAFSPGLNWSQLRLAALSKANLKVASSHYGLNVGEDGATAQMLEDIALMRVLPNFTVLSPADYQQAYSATIAAAAHTGPTYIRYTRSKFPVFLKEGLAFNIGQGQKLKEGSDVTLVATGSMVFEALKATAILDLAGISVELINMPSIKPLDNDIITTSTQKTKRLVTIEEHQIAGGLGSACLEALAQNNVQSLLLGVQDEFGVSGDGYEVMKQYGLHADTFVQRIRAFINK